MRVSEECREGTKPAACMLLTLTEQMRIAYAGNFLD
jgi:hypothetical protein